MLKRYSHLSAFLLVPKLDPKPRTKKDRPVLRDQLLPYPAVVTQHSRRFDIDFPDFLNLSFSGNNEVQVIENAKAHLLRAVVGLLCDGAVPPVPTPPDSIQLPSAKSRVEMISPI